jgi:hypothetical protein
MSKLLPSAEVPSRSSTGSSYTSETLQARGLQGAALPPPLSALTTTKLFLMLIPHLWPSAFYTSNVGGMVGGHEPNESHQHSNPSSTLDKVI